MSASNITHRLEFQNAEDVVWFACFFVGSLMVCMSLFTCSLVVQHLHCVEHYFVIVPRQTYIEPPFTVFYSTLTVVFGVICVLLIFSSYPVCTAFVCGYNALGNFYYITILDSYIATKLFLYCLFIGRLFNPFYAKIYAYPDYVRYILYSLIVVVLLTTLAASAAPFYTDDTHEQHRQYSSLLVIGVCVYVFCDFVLSGITLCLFVRPLYSAQLQSQTSESVVYKYIVISSIQCISATLYGITLIVRFFFGWYHTNSSNGNSFLDVCSVLQMIDVLSSMICLYLGFVRKQSYQRYCEICERYWIALCCSCCTGYSMEIYYRYDWNRFVRKQQQQRSRNEHKQLFLNVDSVQSTTVTSTGRGSHITNEHTGTSSYMPA